jgi:Holliday junction resolvase
MPVNSKQKGARGERAWRDVLRENGYEAHRACQYSGKSPDGTSADVNSELPFHFEVKHCERWPIRDWIAQATQRLSSRYCAEITRTKKT